MRNSFLGCVNLPFVYQVIKTELSNTSRPCFSISVSMSIDNKKREQGKCDLIFSCDSVEARDRWMACIDYLKTKAIFDAYSKNNYFINLSAPKRPVKHNDQDGEYDEDYLVPDFGKNFRNSTNKKSQLQAAAE